MLIKIYVDHYFYNLLYILKLFDVNMFRRYDLKVDFKYIFDYQGDTIIDHKILPQNYEIHCLWKF